MGDGKGERGWGDCVLSLVWEVVAMNILTMYIYVYNILLIPADLSSLLSTVMRPARSKFQARDRNPSFLLIYLPEEFLFLSLFACNHRDEEDNKKRKRIMKSFPSSSEPWPMIQCMGIEV